ncbi:Hypothetical_protein [Hexamita inflata]|uniref:Hypothetical_protein n=1 Tax=Hexamita inflata TaxID=28002 RepID=A0AA86UNT9_9EUKA|nr:Hypothetical protein HINF_LOCUS53340 [Hexamita inflata]
MERLQLACVLRVLQNSFARATVKQITAETRRSSPQMGGTGHLEWKDCLICWFVDENACDGRQREITFQILDRLVSSHCICESHTDQFTESAMKFIQCFM